jgi:hypothetical protein
MTMRHREFLKLEQEHKGQLLLASKWFLLLRETLVFAGAMALVLTIADATPWPLGHENPVSRVVFILMWAVIMAWIELSLVRHRESERAKGEQSSVG